MTQRFPRSVSILFFAIFLLLAQVSLAHATTTPGGTLVTTWGSNGAVRDWYWSTAGNSYMGVGIRSAGMDSQGRIAYGLYTNSSSNVERIYFDRKLSTGADDTNFDQGYIAAPTSLGGTNTKVRFVTDLEFDSSDNIYSLVQLDFGTMANPPASTYYIIKLIAQDGTLDDLFAGGINDGFLPVAGIPTALSLDSVGNIYALTTRSVGQDDGIVSIQKFNSNGLNANFTGSNSNFIDLDDDYWGGTLLYSTMEANGNRLVIAYQRCVTDGTTPATSFDPANCVAHPHPRDGAGQILNLVVTTVDLSTGTQKWNQLSDTWETDYRLQNDGEVSGSAYPLDLTIDPSGWISVVGSDHFTNSRVFQAPFIVQLSTASANAYWLATPALANSAVSVMAGGGDELYVLFNGDSGPLLRKYKADGGLDTDFQSQIMNFTEAPGDSFGDYILGTDDSVTVIGENYSTVRSANTYDNIWIAKFRSNPLNVPDPPVVTTPVPIGVSAPSPTNVPSPSLARGSVASGPNIAALAGVAAPAKSKITLKVSSSSKKICKVAGTNLKTLLAGTCSLSISVKPPKPAIVNSSGNLLVQPGVISAEQVASQLGASVPSGSKISVSVSGSSKKICSASGSKLKVKAAGNCTVKVKIQAPQPATTTKTLSITVN